MKETSAIMQKNDDHLLEVETLPHYLSRDGEQYFIYARQGEFQKSSALMNLHLWKPYISTSDDVLDFGCGSGGLLSILECASKVGVDVNPAARKATAELGIEVHASLSELNDRRFSRIISSHTLEHVPSPFRSLVDLNRLLRKEGELLILLPMSDWRSHDERVYKSNDMNMHIYAWTPQTIGNLLAACGYALQSVKIVTHAFPPGGMAQLLWRVSSPLFHGAAWLTAIIKKRRQLFIVARRQENESESI